jgi:hypothetical protein
MQNSPTPPGQSANLNQPPKPAPPKTIPFDEAAPPKTNTSHAPKATATSKPAATGLISKDKKQLVSTQRISGVKTFYTKLHAGAITFLDEQMNKWLKENPRVVVRKTNTAIGDVIGKKTEPSIIVTIWY